MDNVLLVDDTNDSTASSRVLPRQLSDTNTSLILTVDAGLVAIRQWIAGVGKDGLLWVRFVVILQRVANGFSASIYDLGNVSGHFRQAGSRSGDDSGVLDNLSSLVVGQLAKSLATGNSIPIARNKPFDATVKEANFLTAFGDETTAYKSLVSPTRNSLRRDVERDSGPRLYAQAL